MRIAKTSDTPPIPNFEILGRIGGGSYGEVYLARTVTGMYRAVKVVRREDFEYERTFEREFEGIQRYEPLSHDHPGLVDVLHVGRDREAGFYYYVMELADDESGETVQNHLDDYKARTLASDLRRGAGRSVRECVDLGIAMGSALGHLHRAGLTHRDVKPSNIIFVKGEPKLADAGLVASTGQRTFVGTEGYVPPEGPGTSSADLYSLAMVLYEMHTGKDRLDFPELPTNLEIPPSVNRDEWRALNAAICRAGSPDPRKRYDSAQHFVRALETVCAVHWKAPEPKRAFLPAMFGFVAVLGLLAILGVGGWWIWQDNKTFLEKHSPLLSDSGQSGVNGAGMRTPIGDVAPAGKEGAKIPAGVTTPGAEEKTGGEEKEKKKGAETEAVAKGPGTSTPATGSQERNKSAGEGKEAEVAKKPAETPQPDPDKTPEKEIPALVATEVKGSEAKEMPPPKPPGEPLVAKVVKGRLKIRSEPAAAVVYHDGVEIGVTETVPLEFPVGPIDLVLKREGYRDYVFQGVVAEGTKVFSAVMQPDLGPRAGQVWVNSLGIEFLPTAEGGHRSAGAMGMALFDQFNDETGAQIPRSAQQGIVHVSDGTPRWLFADWVTEKDRAAGYLGAKEYFRPIPSPDGGSKAFALEVSRDFGTLVLNSEPENARVYRGGEFLGETPLVISPLRLGPTRLDLHLSGHASKTIEPVLTGAEPQAEVTVLVPNASVVFGKPWANSLGMEMLPVGGLLVARTETTISEFLEFRAAQGSVRESELSFPASGMTYAEAEAFCEWLTRREREAEWIRPWHRYRLPTDVEWSRFAGLEGEVGSSPEDRGSGGDRSFPWGRDWPPPAGAGNFADRSAAGEFGGRVIEGYDDGFELTAPVGSFGDGSHGLNDLAGNLWEWVADYYNSSGDGLRVVRGGGWNTSQPEMLATAYRNPVSAESADGAIGFRYVLEEAGGE